MNERVGYWIGFALLAVGMGISEQDAGITLFVLGFGVLFRLLLDAVK